MLFYGLVFKGLILAMMMTGILDVTRRRYLEMVEALPSALPGIEPWQKSHQRLSKLSGPVRLGGRFRMMVRRVFISWCNRQDHGPGL